MLLEAGIAPHDLSDVNARIATDKAHAFMQLLAENIGSPNFSLNAGQYWHPTQTGDLGYDWMTSATLSS